MGTAFRLVFPTGHGEMLTRRWHKSLVLQPGEDRAVAPAWVLPRQLLDRLEQRQVGGVRGGLVVEAASRTAVGRERDRTHFGWLSEPSRSGQQDNVVFPGKLALQALHLD